MFSLLQVGRSIDAAPLKWKDVDLELKRVNYIDTKNGEEYIFPMTTKVYEIIKRRKDLNKDTVHVFDYEDSKTGHVPQDCQHHFKVIGARSGKKISHHDLRRTWATAARKLKIDERMIDYCLKHTINDVNAHYFVRNEPEILAAMQSVEDFFISTVNKAQEEKQEVEA